MPHGSRHAPINATPVAPMRPTLRVLGAVALTSALVTGLSYGLPDKHAATGVGLAFLAAVYVLVLRGDDATVRHFGLSLGGLLEPRAIEWRRMAREAGTALAWAALFAALIFPLFWIGFVGWYHPHRALHWVPPASFMDDILGQVMVIALPEEAFYRGYVQTALDDAWKGRVSILGARIGWSLPVTSALFALGHFLTEPRPERLAVFFPALLFGWLRARTGGIGAGMTLHAMSNIFSASLGRGYGLFG